MWYRSGDTAPLGPPALGKISFKSGIASSGNGGYFSNNDYFTQLVLHISKGEDAIYT